MAYKPGSIRWIILPANIAMVIAAACSAFFFNNQDYLAGWITGLVCLIILFGIPDYTKRILTNISSLLNSYSSDQSSELQIPLFADELQSIADQMKKIKEKQEKTMDTSQLSAALVNDIIQHIPFALVVFDEEDKIYYINDLCNMLIGEPREYLTAYPHEYQMFISSWKIVSDGQQLVFSDSTQPAGRQFLISKKNFQFGDTTLSLLTMRDIKSELESQESDSWKKIIRVLNHEIMNSLTPVNALAESIITKKSDTVDNKQLKMIFDSLALISRRSRNLINFVNKYKELNVIPQPVMKLINLDILIADIIKLFSDDLKQYNIEFLVEKPQNKMELLADSALLQQVFLNLIKNSIEALKDTPSPLLKITIYVEETNNVIEVFDNGSGISEKAKPNIFVPYFTTKKGGSGIGLALVKEIIRLHHGEITFSSIPRVETIFKIILPETVT